ncbi:GNAT family N-acetyltransferase [Candidatus Babeliales bacterium]|nr:GNAT family N-acetyltransferase [Candidatus Babeliales bacterium]
MENEETFEDGQYTFHPFKEENLIFLFDWLRQPYIAQWSKGPSEWEQFAKEHQDRFNLDDGSYLVYLSGIPIGYIRFYYTDTIGDGWWGGNKKNITDTVRVIVLIGRPAYLGKGHGVMIIKTFVQNLFKTTGIKRILIGPHSDNKTAIGCYAKAGFQPIGESETVEGTVLLMELKKEAK